LTGCHNKLDAKKFAELLHLFNIWPKSLVFYLCTFVKFHLGSWHLKCAQQLSN